MKIEKINLPFEITSQVELKAIKMERLSNVVLIAGKNGSGKSRLLKLIKSQVPHIPNNEKISKLKTDLSRYKEHITQQEKQIQNIDSRLGKGLIKKEEIDSLKRQKQDSEKSITDCNNKITSFKIELEKKSYFTFLPEKEDNVLVNFVPNSLKLRDRSYNL